MIMKIVFVLKLGNIFCEMILKGWFLLIFFILFVGCNFRFWNKIGFIGFFVLNICNFFVVM